MKKIIIILTIVSLLIVLNGCVNKNPNKCAGCNTPSMETYCDRVGGKYNAGSSGSNTGLPGSGSTPHSCSCIDGSIDGLCGNNDNCCGEKVTLPQNICIEFC